MKNKKPVIIVLGEPNSVFIEILAKVLNKVSIKKINYPILLIGSKKLILSQLKFLKLKFKFNILNSKSVMQTKLNNKVYLIDINYSFKKAFEPISQKSKKYISKCFNRSFKFLSSNFSDIIINGPISKKHFLNKNYPGVTEFVYEKSKRNRRIL